MVPVLVKVGVLGALAYLAFRDGGVLDGGSAGSDPVIGRPWDMTVSDPNLEGGRLPAVPLTLGGEITGWYHPVTHKLVAIANANTKIVVGLSPTAHFPPELP